MGRRMPLRSVAGGLAIAGLLATALPGCSEDAGGKEVGGMMLGAAAGGLLGAQFGGGSGTILMATAGVIAGGLLGRNVGRKMDNKDKAEAQGAQQYSLDQTRSGQTTSWNNPNSGNSGTYKPARTYQNSAGQYCREFEQTVTIGGKTEKAHGTACRQPDGSWRVQS